MAKSGRIRLKDLRAAYRLIGECRELGSDARVWRRHMLEGLRQLVGARVALCTQIHDVGTEAERVSAALDVGFLDAAERALWAHYLREQEYRDNPFNLGYFRGFSGLLLTRCLESVVDAREWYLSRHYNEYARTCGVDDRIASSLRLSRKSPVQLISLHRPASDGKYSRRAQRLVHLFHHELGRLLGRQLALPETDSEPEHLPHRLQQVLACLLQGDGEKQIARRLGISRHTVNRHVQRLYRRFNVHSRGELLFCCRDMLPTDVVDVQ
jgi:DNA-binding NarL/FixJ family response regulator